MDWVVAIAVWAGVATTVCAALVMTRNWSWPDMTDDQRQTFAFLSLFAGEGVLTILWVGLYVFEWMMYVEFKAHSELSDNGQEIIWKLMAIHAITLATIAIGNIVSAKLGEWFEIKRQEKE